MKNTLIFVLLFFSFATLQAQEDNLDPRTNLISIGYPAGVFDSPDFGIFVGYNKEWVRKKRFSWEAQASFAYSDFDRDSGTFAHDGGNIYSMILLVGPRFYLNKPSRNTRVYFNLLLGPGYVFISEYRNDGVAAGEFLSEEKAITIGHSLGAYLQFRNKLVIGVGYETFASPVLKLGYKF